MKLLLACLLALLPLMAYAEDLGTLSANEVDPNFLPDPFGTGNPSNPNNVTNELGPYGNPYRPSSATNFEAINSSRLSSQEGNDRDRLSANSYDPDSASNPYGRYGSHYFPDSLNNQFGAGNPYRSDSGQGWRLEGR